MATAGTSSIGGRSWIRGEVTLEEVRALVASFGLQARTLFGDDRMRGSIYDVVVVDGDLDLPGDLSTFGERLAGLVVRGDLDVGGLYADTDDPNTGVYVLGDMRADRVITNGALGVTGSLTVTGPLVGFYNDWSADIRGGVRTPCFYPENHFFDIGGALTAGVVLGYAAKYRVPTRLWTTVDARSLSPDRYRAVLCAQVLDPEEDDGEEAELSYEAFKERVRNGEPVLLGGAVPPAGPEPRARGPAKKRAPAKKRSPAKKNRASSKSKGRTVR